MSNVILKYKTVQIAGRKYNRGVPKFNPTDKWVEYSIDLIEAKRLLQAADFTSKFEVLKVINQIESKVKFHENHEKFDLRTAINELQRAKKLLRL